MIPALIGVALGVLVILLARTIRGENWLYALGLITLPSLYALFALSAGDQAAVFKELTYGLPYFVAGAGFAFVSARHSAVLVGSLWILHAVFDLVHNRFITNAGVPLWYPAFCFSVDIVIGIYLLWLSRRLVNANLHEAKGRILT